jgi:hypothetical protein
MRLRVIGRFVATLVGAGAGVAIGAVAGVNTYAAVGNPEGFEALLGALVGGPIGMFAGSFLGNWITRVTPASERSRTEGRRWAPVLIEGISMSSGMVAGILLLTSGVVPSPGDLGSWLFTGAWAVGGFAIGVHLADRILDSSRGPTS